jgi:DNA-directed RNA polymerase subunit RPC12/RpoP
MYSPEFPIVPHSDAGDPECAGCIVPDVRGDVADLICNECGRVFEQDVARAEVNARLLALAPVTEAASATCPHCGALNVFPRFSAMYAFICSECGEGVAIQRAIQ